MKLLLILGFVGVITCAALVKRDIKDELLKRAAELETQAEAEAKKLEAEGRKHEAQLLRHEEALLKRVAEELQKATDEKQVERLEHELRAIEHRVEEIIKHDERTHPPRPTTPVPNDIKEDLLKRATEVEKLAADEIKKLEAEGRKHEASQLSHEVELVQHLAKRLAEAKDEHEIDRLEVELLAIENRVAELIKRDERTHAPHPTHPVPTHAPTTSAPEFDANNDTIKEDLLKRAVELEAQAEAEAKKLEAKGEHGEAQQLRHEVQALKKLAHELEVGTDIKTIEHLEEQLLRLENHVADIIRRDERTHAPHPTEPVPTHAPTQPPTQQPTKAPTQPPTKLPTKPPTVPTDDIKDELLKRAAELETQAEAEAKKLEAEGRKHEADLLRHEEALLKKVAEELQKATDQKQVERLEHELRAIEHRVEEIIKHDERTHPPRPTTPAVPNDIKEDLLKRATEVEKLAADEIKKLEAEGRKHEATQLSHEVELVQHLAKRLSEAKDEHEIDRLEVELLAIENRVAELIKRDERTHAPHPTHPVPTHAPTTAAGF